MVLPIHRRYPFSIALSCILVTLMAVAGRSAAHPAGAAAVDAAAVAGNVRLVKDIVPGPGSAFDMFSGRGIVFNGRVFFNTYDQTTGTALWQTDGSEAGTVPVTAPDGTPLGHVSALAPFAGYLYITTDAQLWRTDGTAAGTALVTAVPLTSPDSILDLVATTQGLIFATVNGDVFRSDGTAAGTVRIASFPNIPNPGKGPPLRALGRLQALGDRVLFNAYDAVHGYELWSSNGTAAGTALLREINPAGDAYPDRFAVFQNALYFTADDSTRGRGLWKSDGTAAGTQLILPVSASPNPFVVFDPIYGLVPGEHQMFFYSSPYGTSSGELWRTDGTPAGTRKVTALASEISAACITEYTGLPLQVVGDRAFFTQEQATTGTELWSSDGTAAGTALVADINPGPAESCPTDRSRTNITGGYTSSLIDTALLFTATDGVHGYELWRTDGTADGTWMVTDLAVGAESAQPVQLAVLGNQLLVVAEESSTGRELYSIERGLTEVRSKMISILRTHVTQVQPTAHQP